MKKPLSLNEKMQRCAEAGNLNWKKSTLSVACSMQLHADCMHNMQKMQKTRRGKMVVNVAGADCKYMNLCKFMSNARLKFMNA